MLVLATLALGLLLESQASGTAMRITGRLEAPAGAMASARIELLSAVEGYDEATRQLAGEAPAPPLDSARADPAGSFVLRAPGPGCYRVTVRAEGYLTIEHLLVPLLEDRELPPARLTAASPLRARAVGARDEPLPGVWLVAESIEDWVAGKERPAWQPAERSGRTDADGRLTLLRTAGERLALTAFDLRFLGAQRWLGEPTAAGTAEPAEATLHLTSRLALVLEARGPGGHPVGGALLRLGTGRPLGVAGADGRLAVSFDSSQVSTMPGTLTLESPGGDLQGEVAWADARGGVLRIALAPRQELAGQLTDAADGRALAGGVVWAGRMDWRWEAVARVAAMATPGPDGRFKLRWPPCRNAHLGAAAPGYLPAPAAVPRGAAPWRIALHRAVDLAGLVVDGSGRAVAGARVAMRDEGGYGARRAPVATAADGGFRLPRVAAGASYQLTATAPGFAPASVFARPPAPVAGKPGAPVRIVLDAGRSMMGNVVDGAGRPLSGIAVTLVRTEVLPVTDWRLSAAGGESWEARSDQRGAFALRHLSPGRYGLVAHGPGFASTLRPDIDLSPAPSALDLGRIVVETAGAIEGQVNDRHGNPVAGATVRPFPSPKGHPMPDGPERLGAALDRAFTGADGRFRFADLRRGQRFDLYVEHSDHPAAITRDVRVPTAEPLRIELQEGCGLTGRIVDSGRQPVFGARVGAEDESPQEPSDLAFMLLRSRGRNAWTDASGRFSLAGLAAGTVQLEVAAEGYLPVRPPAVEVAAGRESPPLEIVLGRGSSLSGQVRDAAGHPVPGVRVEAYRVVDGLSLAQLLRVDQTLLAGPAMTGDDGRYRLAGLETGRYQVSLVGRRAEPATIEIQPGPNELDLVVAETGTTVSGRVLDAAGAPLAGAKLGLSLDSTARYAASSRADGSFAFDGVEPGQYTLAAAARGYVPSTYPGTVTVSETPAEGLELMLRRAEAAISGRLSGLKAQELSRTHVTAVPVDLAAPGGDLSRRTTGIVDASGAYRIADCAPGAWYVTAITDSGRRASAQVTLDPGAAEAHLDLELAGGATLSGRVSADERPLAGAVIMARAASGSEPSETETASDGTFQISGLAPGTHALLVLDQRTMTGTALTIELAGDREVVVDLTAGAIKGRVVSAAGDPVAGATVTLEGTDRHPLQSTVTTGDDGGFELAPIVIGLYRVTASRPGLAPGHATVQVAPHATAAVELTLAPAAAPR